jgi:hypothetical protein
VTYYAHSPLPLALDVMLRSMPTTLRLSALLLCLAHYRLGERLALLARRCRRTAAVFFDTMPCGPGRRGVVRIDYRIVAGETPVFAGRTAFRTARRRRWKLEHRGLDDSPLFGLVKVATRRNRSLEFVSVAAVEASTKRSIPIYGSWSRDFPTAAVFCFRC